MDPGAGAHVYEMIGFEHRLAIVLDHQHGVAELLEALERREQALIVALMKSDRRLVEDVEHADEARADLSGETDTLALAAGEAARRTVERKVLETDVGEKVQPLANFFQDKPRDFGFLRAQLGR